MPKSITFKETEALTAENLNKLLQDTQIVQIVEQSTTAKLQ